MDLAGAAAIAGTIIGVMTVLATIWATITQRLIDRRKATFDFIRNNITDTNYIAGRNKFLALSKSSAGGLVQFASAGHEGSEETSAIMTVLNQYEIIAIGIQRGAIDFEIYKRFNRGNALAYWSMSKPFVEELRQRTNNPLLYCEYERLSQWLSGNEKPPGPRWSDLFF